MITGLDSILLVKMVNLIETKLGVGFSSGIVFVHTTIADLANYLVKQDIKKHLTLKILGIKLRF